jgi:hypothetical protein
MGPALLEHASLDCTVPFPLLKGEGLLHADMPGTHLLTTRQAACLIGEFPCSADLVRRFDRCEIEPDGTSYGDAKKSYCKKNVGINAFRYR